MMKILLEYVWLDAFDNLRSKIKIFNLYKTLFTIDDCPKWNFDGSSTGQAEGHKSDVILNPVRLYKNPFYKNMESYLVLCECLNPDLTPHETNKRIDCENSFKKFSVDECLFGIELEYVLFERNNKPYKWLNECDPGCGKQGPYYCSVGGDRNFGREISNEHLFLCLDAGINICGTNAEVMPSQWEFQIGPCDMLCVSDDLIMAKYILNRVTEKYNCYVSFYPKPFSDWNGSGGHTNFSTNKMRSDNSLEYIYMVCEKLKEKHNEHIKVYGNDNDKRLTGIHETSSINDFSYGVADRGCSIRIPLNVFNDGCGYIEDRRPAANLNPYIVTNMIVNTVLDS
jgi:glutamine synthetase